MEMLHEYEIVGSHLPMYTSTLENVCAIHFSSLSVFCHFYFSTVLFSVVLFSEPEIIMTNALRVCVYSKDYCRC